MFKCIIRINNTSICQVVADRPVCSACFALKQKDPLHLSLCYMLLSHYCFLSTFIYSAELGRTSLIYNGLIIRLMS